MEIGAAKINCYPMVTGRGGIKSMPGKHLVPAAPTKWSGKTVVLARDTGDDHIIGAALNTKEACFTFTQQAAIRLADSSQIAGRLRIAADRCVQYCPKIKPC